jgi:poly-gamma-glutamate capsule biosynthesis protein CapA/YwtB (metallophosphatase superfamily)
MSQQNNDTARLLAVGDIYFNRPSNERPYNDLAPLLAAADLRFCNYEAPISDVTACLPGRRVPLNTPPGNLAALEAGRFDIVSLANNHILDYGFEALDQTLTVLDRRQAPYTGAGRTLAQAMTPVVFERNGVHFGALAFACAFPPSYAATPSQPGLAPIRVRVSYVPNHTMEAEHPGMPPAIATAVEPSDLAAMLAAVAELKRRVDHVIVSYHWGVPGRRDLLHYQVELGRATVDAGASLVLGHHAHVLQPVEVYKTGLIVYGLSHFVFDLPGIISGFGFDTETAAASVDFGRDQVRGAALIPLVMEEGAGPRRPSPREGERIFGLLRDLSAPLGAPLTWDAERGAAVVPL